MRYERFPFFALDLSFKPQGGVIMEWNGTGMTRLRAVWALFCFSQKQLWLRAGQLWDLRPHEAWFRGYSCGA
jgi:hypothetical protein